MTNNSKNDTGWDVGWWQPVLFAAMAGGMGWGIRGQYGHETGAMIAGLLVSLVLVCLLCRNAPSLWVARAVALGTVAIGFGGTMTYGQTVGLTHDGPLVGNWEALRWGMLGLAIKGAVWIGFFGVFLGMGMGGIRYRSRELLLLMFGVLIAYHLGVYLLNAPFAPANRLLPTVYFSDHWHWEPDTDLIPRRECWGGLLFALTVTVAYVGWRRKDGLAWRIALWGVLGGAIGFPLGQSLQALFIWSPGAFQEWPLKFLSSHMAYNTWNMMETTYGTVMGGILGLGLWFNRKRIQPYADANEELMPSVVEWTLLVIHATLLVTVEFGNVPMVDAFYDLGLVMGIIPIVAVVGGRWWPYLMVFPVTLLPIVGKTVRHLVYNAKMIEPMLGWIVYLIVPLTLITAAFVCLGRQTKSRQLGHDFTRYALLLNTWAYFFLNFAFYNFPWPWPDETGRGPTGIIYPVCAVGLTVMALTTWNRKKLFQSETVENSECH